MTRSSKLRGRSSGKPRQARNDDLSFGPALLTAQNPRCAQWHRGFCRSAQKPWSQSAKLRLWPHSKQMRRQSLQEEYEQQDDDDNEQDSSTDIHPSVPFQANHRRCAEHQMPSPPMTTRSLRPVQEQMAAASNVMCPHLEHNACRQGRQRPGTSLYCGERSP